MSGITADVVLKVLSSLWDDIGITEVVNSNSTQKQSQPSPTRSSHQSQSNTDSHSNSSRSNSVSMSPVKGSNDANRANNGGNSGGQGGEDGSKPFETKYKELIGEIEPLIERSNLLLKLPSQVLSIRKMFTHIKVPPQGVQTLMIRNKTTEKTRTNYKWKTRQ